MKSGLPRSQAGVQDHSGIELPEQPLVAQPQASAVGSDDANGAQLAASASALSQPTSTLAREEPHVGVRARLTSNWLWRARGFWLGGTGLGLALFGQKVLTVDHDVVGSIRWYALGIVVVLLAWMGTYKNKSLLVEPVRRLSSVLAATESTLPVRASRAKFLASEMEHKRRVSSWWWLKARSAPRVSTIARYVVALVALALNLYSANLIRQDYYSAIGGWGWVASLLLLVLAFVRQGPVPARSLDAGIVEVEDRTDPRPSRRVEIIIVAAIFMIGLFFRFYRLGDWTTGVHGDEGEAGMAAMSILQGNRVSPFLTGWFSQPNFYYWGIAAGLKLFGTSLFGDRAFSAIMGTLMLLPFYPLVRMWFGVRTAILATIFLSISDVTVQFTRMEASNITTPASLVIGFYFLARGLRDKRALNFVLAGYGFMFGLYFYNGGRLAPFLLAGVLGYLFVLAPLLRVPGAYGQVRRLVPGLGRVGSLGRAVRGQAQTVLHYIPQVLVLVVACISFASPFWVYFNDHSAEMNGRAASMLIFNNEARMTAQYAASHQVSHAPLYFGVRMPTPNDIYPVVPFFFEKTPLSVKLSDDGYWPRVLWAQTTTTLSVFTYRIEASSFYTFSGEPVAKPIEAVLFILGLAWAMWRWRDARMAILLLWFWSAVIAGGVLTMDAPYMARIIGVVPVVAIFAALPLSKLSAELVAMFGRFSRGLARSRMWKKFGLAVSGTAVVTLMVYLILQNYSDYFRRYLAPYPFNEVTGQAQFVRNMNAEVVGEGRPQPVYYDLGMHMIYWAHGTNRFLNYGTEGRDMANPANDLPILDNAARDVVFMVWGLNSHYMQAIKTYYPEGEEGSFAFGPNGTGAPLFKYYRVKKEQIEARQVSLATYTPATGPTIQRQEPGIGSSGPVPVGLNYPVRTEWRSSLMAPTFGRYTFSLDTVGAGRLLIDGAPVLTNTAQVTRSQGELLLARGPHDVRLTGILADTASQVAFKWSSSDSAPVPIARQFLWNGPGRGLLGVIRPYQADITSEPPSGTAGGGSSPTGGVVSERIDGFLGFRDAPSALGGGPLYGTWTGTLTITDTGTYSFDVFSNGSSAVYIDGDLVVRSDSAGGQATAGAGQVELTAGQHRYELRYQWQTGIGYLEAFWTPPGGVRTLLGTDALRTDGGVVDPKALAIEPPPVVVSGPAEGSKPATANILKPSKAFSLRDAGVVKPRGLAVDKAGNVYVGDRGNRRIVVLSPDGKLLKAWGKTAPQVVSGQPSQLSPGDFGDITDVAVSDTNTTGADFARVTVYALDSTGRVQAFTGNGDPVGTYEASQLALFAGNGIAVSVASVAKSSPSGTVSLYLAVTGQNRIASLPSVQTLLSRQAATPGADNVLGLMIENITGNGLDKLEQPVDVVADPTDAGILYAIDLKDRIIQLKYLGAGPATATAGGVSQSGWTIAKSWKVPVGRDDGGSRLGISPDGGRVYMSDPDRKRVAVLDVKSGGVSYFGADGGDAGQFRSPLGLDVGANGQVYVLDRDNVNVQVFPAEAKP